jgi:hypothetical protein
MENEQPFDREADEAARAKRKEEIRLGRVENLRKARAKIAEARNARVVHNHLKLTRRPKKTGKGTKEVTDFLYPPMPGAFLPSEMRKKDAEYRIARYMKTYSATMGNHSISLFYAAWNQEDFEIICAEFPEFPLMIAEEKNRLADRAQFMLHKTMGLIPNAGELDDTHQANAAALARVVEKINEGRTDTRSTKGVALRVEGLERPKRNPS